LRLLGVVHLAAFGSFLAQAHGLVGSDGIAPISEVMARLPDTIGWLNFPGLQWLGTSDLALWILGGAGLAGGVALLLGLAPRITLVVLWLLYLTVFQVGGPFLSFQWDLLLLEVTLLAIPYAPGGLWPRLRSAPPPSKWATWLLRLVLFKLMFSSGVVKLNHADPTWESLTALSYHFWTQPLPHGMAWYAHQLPEWVLKVSVSLTLLVEVALPFLIIFNPRRWRLAGYLGAALVLTWFDGGVPSLSTVLILAAVAALLDDRVLHRIVPGLVPEPAERGGARVAAAVGFVGLMALISATGNYGFFQLLTVALCVVLLDDGFFWWLTPARQADRWPDLTQLEVHPASRGLAVLAMAVFVVISALTGVSLFGGPTLRSAFAAHRIGDASMVQSALVSSYELRRDVLKHTRPFASINGYGLFASMTTHRYELDVQGSADGQTWQSYRFHYKPHGPEAAPPIIGVHMPRLDWQMWFAALGDQCPRKGWLVSFQQRLLQGSPTVRGLLAEDPFGETAPTFIRIRRALYRFADQAARDQDGHFWQTSAPEVWCPPVSLKTVR
jgi:hypothetical protein